MSKKPSKAVTKVATPRGEAQSIAPVSTYGYTAALNVRYGQTQGIVQGNGADWFGPLNPLAPIAPPDVAGRQMDFPVGYNLQVTPRNAEIIGFPLMRMLADSYDLLRLVIETRKDQLCKLKWKIRLKAEVVAEMAAEQNRKLDAQKEGLEEDDEGEKIPSPLDPRGGSGKTEKLAQDEPEEDDEPQDGGAADRKAMARLAQPKKRAPKKLRPKDVLPTPEQKRAIDEITKLFARPDGVNRWRPWLRALLEDLFVIDAPSIYCQRNRGGKLIALKPVDGGTIKVLIDDWGRTPVPQPGQTTNLPPAYQQVLKGFPAVIYTVRDLMYRPNNRRPHKVYGYSPVEQIIMTVNIALRRQTFQLAYYTEGNIPEALIGTPDTWTPDQIKAFQAMWDQMHTGNLAARRHAKFVPGGVAKTYIPTKEPDLKNPMDEWLARIVCFAFSISPQGLIAMMNRATAESGAEQAKEEGIEPAKEWVAELVNDVIEQEFKRDDIEFAFDEEVEVDQKTQADIVTKLVEDGLKTHNEGRAMLGDEPSDDPACDQPMVKTATGFVPLNSNTIEGKAANIAAFGMPDPFAPPNPFGGKRDDEEQDDKTGSQPPKKTGEPAAEKHVHKRARRLPALDPFESQKVRALAGSFAATLYRAFRKAGSQASQIVLTHLQKHRGELVPIGKADSDENEKLAREIAAKVNLSAIEDVVVDLGGDLGDVAREAAYQAIAQVGVSDRMQLVNQVFDRAVTIAQQRAVTIAQQYAAELVGMRFDEQGRLVEAARPEYRIDETTRNMLRTIIADGLDDGDSSETIAAAIEDATAFSAERARIIAETEVRRANSAGALEGYREAADLGIVVKKEWLLGPNPCEICQGNADQGAIDLDDVFDSGDDAPPAHPNCECAISPVVVEDAESD